ncbi:hypothetical protein C1752_01321 [Acaryochloris thomasi RCC1774]|uniref:Type IV pilin PilA n=1 Tax=Acaryochloris thomasi RCC1774 TaxID=1764569 RepID=A0A2W1JLT0_9CYAN|nr:hypothetical protein [Acaryochloris thomasi]PZD74323.1 hypothetical protein C1752_01321 [Acaryochloris thomasi RCC1774]
MPVSQTHYEELLATYSNHQNAVALLRQYRPYFEKVPSIRRSKDSVVTIPLPVVQVRQQVSTNLTNSPYELIQLPCDLALLMCDPEWKIKTGVEIIVFIYRPGEDFSDLLNRWRQTQVLLSRGYNWEMPLRFQHIFSEGAEKVYPLFIIFSETSGRIERGLRGASLPFVVHAVQEEEEEPLTPREESLSQPSAIEGEDFAAGSE